MRERLERAFLYYARRIADEIRVRAPAPIRPLLPAQRRHHMTIFAPFPLARVVLRERGERRTGLLLLLVRRRYEADGKELLDRVRAVARRLVEVQLRPLELELERLPALRQRHMRVVEVRGHVREAVDEPAVEQDLRRAFGVGAVLCVWLLRGLDDHWGREEGRGDAVVVRGRRRGGGVLIRPVAVASKTEAEGRARRGAVGGLVLLCGVALIRALRARRIARARELGRQLGREGVRACMHVRRRRRSRERSSSTPILRGVGYRYCHRRQCGASWGRGRGRYRRKGVPPVERARGRR